MSLRRFLRAGVATALLATGMIVAAPAAYAADATFTGSVVDNDDVTATGGQVMMFEPEPGVKPAYGDIGSDGTFSVTAPIGPYYVIAIPPAGSDLAPGAPFDVADSSETAGTYALTDPLTFATTMISGTVTDESGAPIEGAWVLGMDASGMGGGGGGGDDMGGGGGDDMGSHSDDDAKGDGSASTSGTESEEGGEGGPEYFGFTDANGSYNLGVPAGPWIVFAYNPADDSMTPPGADSMVTAAAGSVATKNLQFPTPNVSGTVVDPDGNPYAKAFVMALQCDSGAYEAMGECWIVGDGGFGVTGSDGTFNMALAQAGTYQLEVEPKDGDTSVVRHAEVFVLAAAGDTKSTWGSPASATITLVAPNVLGTVTHPTTGAGLNDAWVMAVPAISGRADWSRGPTAMGPTTRDDTGTFTMALTAGDYIFEVDPPWRGGAGMMRSSTAVTIVSGSNTVSLEIGIPNVSGTFKTADGTAVKWGYMVLCASGGGDNACWGGSAPVASDGSGIYGNVDDSGGIAIAVNPYVSGDEVFGGTYVLRIEPDPFQNQGTSLTNVDIEMNLGNTGLESASVNGVSVLNDDGTITVTAGTPNLTGVVVDGDGDAVGSTRSTWVGVCASNKTTYEHVGCSGADSSGNFGLALAASGTYRVEVEPPWDSTTYSRKTYTVVVDSSEAITSCVDANSVACTTVSGSFRLALGTPNLSGTISGYSGSADGWMEVMLGMDPDGDGTIDWYDWVASGNVGGTTGSFALSVDDGTYKIKASPGWSMSGVSAAEANVTIAGSTVTCNSGCTVSGGSVSMAWGTPNLSGTVMAGSSAAGEAQIDIKIGVDWDTDGTIDYYDWDDWAMANSSGKFGISLSSAGTYQIDVRPGWGTTGYASASYTVVTASSGGSIVVSSVTDSSSIGVTAESDGGFNLSLATPNFSGVIVKPDGTTAALDSDIQVFKKVDGNSDGDFDDPEDYFNWIGGTHAQPSTTAGVTSAAFAMMIDSAGTFEIEVWPSWSDTTSIRRRTTITAALSDSTITVSCNTVGICVTDNDGITTITLGTSNISGLVTASDGTALVSWSGVDVMQDSDGVAGTGESGYEDFVDWFNIGDTASDATSNFKGYLDDGSYLFKAFPAWTDQDSQPTNFVVTVASSGTTVTCASPCTATDNVLAVTLSSGNLSGTVTSSSGDPLANAIVFLYNDSDGDGNGSSDLNTTEFIRDTVTNASGAYSILVDSGECDTGQGSCVVKVQPPPPVVSGSATDQDSISSSVTVTSTGDTQTKNVTMTAAN